VLVLRHALAPGTGDPPGFEIDDCSTQRNLNEEGRAQARAWKSFLREHGIEKARVLSSQWCRALDTAEEMDLGEVKEFPPLNSFFAGRGDREEQSRKTIKQVNAMGEGPPIILVSHQVNITALTGIYPASNEGIIVRLPLERGKGVLAEITPKAQSKLEQSRKEELEARASLRSMPQALYTTRSAWNENHLTSQGNVNCFTIRGVTGCIVLNRWCARDADCR